MRMFWPCISLLHSPPPRRGCNGEKENPLLDNFRDDAGADSAATFADCEANFLFHGDRRDELDGDRDVVARHNHFRAFGELDGARYVGRAEVELRTIVGEERRVTATLFLVQDVGLGGELLVRLDAARLAKNLTALDGFLVDAAKEATDVVAGFARIEQLAEHFDAGDDRLLRIADADDLDFFADIDDATFDTAGDDRAAARDREHVFDRHQERLILRTFRDRNEGIHRFVELDDGFISQRALLTVQRLDGGAADNRRVVAGE